MYHGLTHETIYAAARTIARFESRTGDVKEISGTSFGLIVEEKLVMVTNRHMVDLNFGRTDAKYVEFSLRHLICEIRARDTPGGDPGATRRLIVPMTDNQLLFDANPRNDVAVIFDAQTGNLDGSIDRRWEYCFTWADVATEQELRTELQPFDVLAFPGFPEGFDKLGLRAIIRGGTVACDPRFDYSFESEDRGEILLYEGFSFGGSSGSPVIAIPKVPPVNVVSHPANRFRRLLVVGVNAGHLTVPTGQHAGLSYFVRSSVIRRIVEPHLNLATVDAPPAARR
jgi:hypothetical protein